MEQFFECYEIENVMIGVDSLFKYFHEVDCNMDQYEKSTVIGIDIGANTIHVFCIIDGKVQYENVKRLNLGGNQAF
jgi:actin-related protein